jgi:hypothetical protein
MRRSMRLALLALALTLLLVAPASAATRLVRYDIAGGLAPTSDSLVVNTDGSARQTGNVNRRFQLSDTQLRRLKRDLRAARFESLKRSYNPDEQVLDGSTQFVRYKGRSVSVYADAEVPKRLERVLRRLGNLLD